MWWQRLHVVASTAVIGDGDTPPRRPLLVVSRERKRMRAVSDGSPGGQSQSMGATRRRYLPLTQPLVWVVVGKIGVHEILLKKVVDVPDQDHTRRWERVRRSLVPLPTTLARPPSSNPRLYRKHSCGALGSAAVLSPGLPTVWCWELRSLFVVCLRTPTAWRERLCSV